VDAEMTRDDAKHLAESHVRGEITLTEAQQQKLLRFILSDEEEWEDEEAIVPLQEHNHGHTENSVLSELLVDMMCAVTKLTVLLAEADEDEFKLVQARLNAFRSMVDSLPEKPTVPKKVVGFKAKSKKRAKKTT
jgi:hypothetical protein